MLDPWSLEQASTWGVLKFRPEEMISGASFYTPWGLKTDLLPFLINWRLKQEKLIKLECTQTEHNIKGSRYLRISQAPAVPKPGNLYLGEVGRWQRGICWIEIEKSWSRSQWDSCGLLCNRRREEGCNADTAEQGINLGTSSPRDFTCFLPFADRTSCCFLIN